MESPAVRWAWETMRGSTRVTLTFTESDRPVNLSVERLDGTALRPSDLAAVLDEYDSVLDECRESRRRWREQMVEHRVRIEDISGLTDADRAFALAEGIDSVPVYVGRNEKDVQREVRMTRHRGTRVRLTDEVLRDVASIVELHPNDWVDVLMARYGWESREHAWRVKGRAVKAGYLPPVEDGRGQAKRGSK